MRRRCRPGLLEDGRWSRRAEGRRRRRHSLGLRVERRRGGGGEDRTIGPGAVRARKRGVVCHRLHYTWMVLDLEMLLKVRMELRGMRVRPEDVVVLMLLLRVEESALRGRCGGRRDLRSVDGLRWRDRRERHGGRGTSERERRMAGRGGGRRGVEDVLDSETDLLEGSDGSHSRPAIRRVIGG